MRLPRPFRRGPMVPDETAKQPLQRRHSVHQAHHALGRFDFLSVVRSRSRDHHGGARTWLLKGADGIDTGGRYPKHTIDPPRFRQIIGGSDGMTSCWLSRWCNVPCSTAINSRTSSIGRPLLGFSKPIFELTRITYGAFVPQRPTLLAVRIP